MHPKQVGPLVFAVGTVVEQVIGHGRDHIHSDVTIPIPQEIRPHVLTAATTTTPAPNSSGLLVNMHGVTE